MPAAPFATSHPRSAPVESGRLFSVDRLASVTLFIGLAYILTPTNLDFSGANPLDLSRGAEQKIIDYAYNLLVFAGIALVAWHRRLIIAHGLSKLNPWFLAYMGWCLASVIWTANLGETLTTLIRLFFDLLLMAIIVFSPRSPQASIRLLHGQFALLLGACLIFVVFVPAWGITAPPSVHAGSWRGITDHKNSLAQLIIFASIIWAYVWTVTPTQQSRMPAAVVLLALIMAVGTTSSSGILLTFAAIPLVYVLASPRFSGLVQSRTFWVIVAIVGIALAYGYVVLAGAPSYVELLGPVAQAFGKDVTLTGRTDIWVLMLEQARDHWLVGYGLGAYWVGDVGFAAAVWKLIGIELWQAHNGFIDVINESGAIGFGLLLIAMLSHGRWAMRRLKHDSSMSIHLALLLILAVSNVTESSYSRPMELGNILMYFLFLCRARLQLPSGAPPTGERHVH